MPEITTDEMAKAKVGFAIRLINRDLRVDSALPDDLEEHDQAALEYFLTIQEASDQRMGEYRFLSSLMFGILTRTQPPREASQNLPPISGRSLRSKKETLSMCSPLLANPCSPNSRGQGPQVSHVPNASEVCWTISHR
jgi:hypothetical protein